MCSNRVLFCFFAFLISCNSSALHAAENSLKQIIAMPNAPDGVVIEIVTHEDAGLIWALPIAQKAVYELRRRFNQLPIAIVTHGREQFALAKNMQSSNQGVHNAVKSLMQDKEIQVHVCGTFAGWRGLNPEDFPEYVNVSAAGPAQINDYKSLGYLLLTIDSENFVTD